MYSGDFPLGMPLKEPSRTGRTPEDKSDYHPGLAWWKPLERALRNVCGENGFTADEMINALAGIVPPELFNSLHQLRIFRNKLVHHDDVSLLDQAGADSSEYIQKCALLTAYLDALSVADRERAHHALLAGNNIAPEQLAWNHLVIKLRELTSKESPFDCITALSPRVPRAVSYKLYELRKSWSELRKGRGDCSRFIADINSVLLVLNDFSPRVADKNEHEPAKSQKPPSVVEGLPPLPQEAAPDSNRQRVITEHTPVPWRVSKALATFAAVMLVISFIGAILFGGFTTTIQVGIDVSRGIWPFDYIEHLTKPTDVNTGWYHLMWTSIWTFIVSAAVLRYERSK